MRALRIVATLVTGMTMAAGGIALIIHGPEVVVLLGVLCAGVGIAYAYAGLWADLSRRQIAGPRPDPGARNSSVGEATGLLKRRDDVR